ncbi:hypothetical protein [Ligilactobacillus apodemi]|uniref:Uncharacterized protein n=1 Tax=Ligilactobacillus apodemi DSM 16634 = JCM 16172 TaxID=1423724 RepID=A0A0R1TS44_9LACO|nr:hypothetical protein [Ligilactobacillus apodemi]KRL84025.1 hypothetical protein FC32_GL001301 [Ligilactobacillus apodemi DSM 16634 = JCM 16172]
MNNVNSEKAVHTVSNVLEELKFETYFVAIKNDSSKNNDFNAVITGDTETVAKLLLSFLNAVPKQVKVQMQQYLREDVTAEILRRERDE